MDAILQHIDDGPEPDKLYDLLIVGGGVNGTGIARDAAMRGLSVCLLEKGDLASGTSSQSTKLIHGGLRYLQYGAFGLVRKALIERAKLLDMLPGFVRPIRLILPHRKNMRPQWLLWLGLVIYDHLGAFAGLKKGALEKSCRINLKTDELGAPLVYRDCYGFEFSDCVVDDARLVIFNAIEASALGARICPRREVVGAECVDQHWRLLLKDGQHVLGKVLINSTGPYLNQFIEKSMQGFVPSKLRLVRGSHIIVPQIYDHGRAFMLQQNDGRMVFVIPYEDGFSLVGTTEVDHKGELSFLRPSEGEISYLLEAVNQNFKRKVVREDIVYSFAGVRPLVDAKAVKSSSISRDYKLVIERANSAPVVHVYGGKITTFRALSKDVVDLLSPYFVRLNPSSTDRVAYSAFERQGFEKEGSEKEGFDEWLSDFHKRLAFLPSVLRGRYVRSYGRRADWFLRNVNSIADMGQYFGGGLYLVELRYLVANEWVRCSDDVIWRRTKCGLRMDDEQQTRLKDWFANEGLRDRIL